MFLWVYALCSPLAGVIGDRFSKKRLVALSLCLWSGATFFTGTCHSPIPLLACRSFIGVTEALFYPAAAALIADAHGPSTRSRALAFFNSGSVLGVVSGGSYGGYVAEHFQWRLAFYSLGIAGALYALPLLAFLRGVPEKKVLTEQHQAQGPGVFFHTPMYLSLCIVYSTFTFTLYLLYTWLPVFLTEKFSLGLANAGFTATAWLNGASLAGLVLGGWGADLLQPHVRGARFWVLVTAVCLAAPCVYTIAIAKSLQVTILAASGFGICAGLFISNMFASAFEVVAPSRRASAAGFLNLVGAFVSGFAGLLGGLLKRNLGIDGLMSISAALCLAVGIFFIFGIRMFFERDYVEQQI
jgi:MFS transporter, Spinster family, sphingosine-1-phosphate transporter